jgi:molecular chaperone GrpE
MEGLTMDTKKQEFRNHPENTDQSEEMHSVEYEEDHSLHKEEENFSSTDTDTDVLLDKLEHLKEQVDHYKSLSEQLQKQVEETHQQYLRSLADLDNYRRRARKDKEDALKYAVVPLLEVLLPILDNFERALEAADQNDNSQVLLEGIEMVYRQFLNALSQSGLTMIEAEGKPFDPYQHNAVMQVEVDGVESGIVVEELQTGYKYHDRVIRPTMVKISI